MSENHSMASAGPSLDEVAAFLDSHLRGSVGALEPLYGGEWSSAFGFEYENQELVVRFGRYREDYEADLLAMGYAGPELPVPRVLEIGEAFDGAFAISERKRGIALEKLDSESWKKMLPSLWRGLDWLRELEVEPLDDDWRVFLLQLLEDSPGARVSGWTERLRSLEEAYETFQRGRHALEALLPDCPPGGHIVHNDLLHGNVLVDPDKSRIVAVFDWGTSLQVDFLYELAGLVFFAPWFRSLPPDYLVAQAASHYRSSGLHVPDYERRLGTYMLHIGVMHVAYGAFADRPTWETNWVAGRTKEVMAKL